MSQSHGLCSLFCCNMLPSATTCSACCTCILLSPASHAPLVCSESWVSEFKKAATTAATNVDSKSAVTSAFSNISQLSSSAQKGDASGAKQAFVGAVSSLQSWASGSGLTVKGL